MLLSRHGTQGEMDGASKATLDNEFGTNVDEEVIKQILEKGTIQESTVSSTSFHPVSTLLLKPSL